MTKTGLAWKLCACLVVAVTIALEPASNYLIIANIWMVGAIVVRVIEKRFPDSPSERKR